MTFFDIEDDLSSSYEEYMNPILSMQELDNGRRNELIWVPLNKLMNNENKRSSGIK